LTAEIPEKLYFKIGEVADITGIMPYELRYWEKEYPSIKPHKTRTNQRVYQKKDVEAVLLIKSLLYEYKYTIAGARDKLKELKQTSERKEEIPVPAVSDTVETGDLFGNWSEKKSMKDAEEWRKTLTIWRDGLGRVIERLKNIPS